MKIMHLVCYTDTYPASFIILYYDQQTMQECDFCEIILHLLVIIQNNGFLYLFF
jgi:hypothetical protein